jgi:hypothetical protein
MQGGKLPGLPRKVLNLVYRLEQTLYEAVFKRLDDSVLGDDAPPFIIQDPAMARRLGLDPNKTNVLKLVSVISDQG